MEESKGNLIADVPKNALSIQRFLNSIKEPIKTAFQDQSFMVYGDVDRVAPWNGCYYLHLVEKASSYTYKLVVFISKQLAISNKIEIRPKMKLLVLGNIALNKNEVQLNAVQFEDLGYSRLHKQIEDWKKTYKNVFERKKKQLPLLCQRIAIVSNTNIQGYEDFSKHMKYGNLTVMETKMQGDMVAEDIALAIEKINLSKSYDCIMIIRGGGSFTDLYEFNKPALLEAIAHSMIPVASAVGHETDFPLCDFAADIRFSTPTHAGKELTERVEYLKMNVSDWKKIFSNAAILKLQAIEGNLKQLALLIINRNKSIIESTLQEITKQGEVMMLAIIARIDKSNQSLYNMRNSITLAHRNVLNKYERSVKVTGEQILNTLHYAAEKNTQKIFEFQNMLITAYHGLLQSYAQTIIIKSDQFRNSLKYSIGKNNQKVFEFQNTFSSAYYSALQNHERAIIIKNDRIKSALRYATDNNKEKVNNLQRTLSAANYGAIQRYEQAIVFRREQIENGLRKALEKDNIKRKNRTVILLATIIIAVLITIIIILFMLK